MNISFRFHKDSTAVDINIDTGLAVERPIMLLKWEAGSQMSAAALACHLQDAFDKRVREIRETAYRAGWKDRAAKRAKKSHFSDVFVRSDNHVEYVGF